MKRRTFVLAAGLALGTRAWADSAAAAVPPEVVAALPGARLQGQGRLRYLGFQVYDARLWLGAGGDAAVPADDWRALPLALELTYARSLVGAKLAERSLKEMRRQGDIAPDTAARWLQTMTSLIPDVRSGDRLTAIHQPGQGLRLWANALPIGEFAEPDLALRFVGIWLSPQSSEPDLRRALLGRAAS